MLTAAAGRAQRKALDRQRAAMVRTQAREKVKELRAKVREAVSAKRTRVAEARRLCRLHAGLLRKRARARRRRLLEELRQASRQEKLAAKERCTLGRTRAKASALSEAEKARHALAHERTYQAEIKRIEANNKDRACGIHHATKLERKQESDGEVLGNIPAELAPLWKKIGRSIKASARHSRTEAFLHYAAEHPHEVVAAQEGGVDARIRELEARANEAHRFARKRRYTAAELAAVPF